MQVAVHLVNSVVCCNIVLYDSGEVVEDAVSIDTSSIVLAVAVVAGTEGSVCAYEVVTGLHVLNSLIHVTSLVPCLNAIDILAFCVCNLTHTSCPAVSPLLVLTIAEVAVGNQLADVSAGLVAISNSLLQPFLYALCLSLDLVKCSSVGLLDVLIGTERIVFAGLVGLCKVGLEGIAQFTFETVVGIKLSLDVLTLGDICLISFSILGNLSLLVVDSLEGVSKLEDGSSLCQSIEYILILVEQSLSSDGLFYCFFLVRLDSVTYFFEVVFVSYREVLLGSIDNCTVSGIGEGIVILADVLEPEASAELFAVGLPSECTALEVFGSNDAYVFLCAVECIAVLDVVVDASVAVACKVACIAFGAFHFTYGEAVGYFSPVAEPARERAVLLRSIDVADHAAVVDGNVARGAHDAAEYAGSVGTAVGSYVAAHHNALDVDVTCPRSSHTNQSDIAATDEFAALVEDDILNVCAF